MKPVDEESIIEFVKQEPRTIQDVAQHTGLSWVTAEKHVLTVRDRTGLISIKAFRKGTQGAIKVVYYNHPESPAGDLVRERLFEQIRTARFKHHFDFMEIYQHVTQKKRHAILEHYAKENISTSQDLLVSLRKAQRSLLVFSGNLSFATVEEHGTQVTAIFEELLERGVAIKVLCRVTMGSEQNIRKLAPLLAKYPKQFEIRHAFQPLRGYVIDDTFARFKDEEQLNAYKPQELLKNTRVFYDVWDESWVAWIASVFWSFYRTAMPYQERWRAIEQLIREPIA